MRLVQTLRFLTGGWLAGLVLGGAALAQPTQNVPGASSDAPAYERGVVLIQYDEAVYTAHLEDLLDDLWDKLPGGLGGFVGDQSDGDIPLRPVGVVDALLRTNGFPLAEVAARIDSLQTEAIALGKEVDPHTVIDLLKDLLKDEPLAGVLHAQPNFIYHPSQASDAYATDQTSDPDPARTSAWHLKAIQLRDAWDEVWDRAPARPPGAGPLTIGILDTGVDFGNSDLYGKKWSKTDCRDENGAMTTCNGGRDFVGDTHDADPTPVSDNHGSLVASVAAGEFNNGYGSFGVAQDVELVGIRAGDTSFTTLDAVQGVNFARHNQLDIINVSLSSRHAYQNCNEYSLTEANSFVLEYQALQHHSEGLFVMSAGNRPEESGGVDTVRLPADFASAVSLSGQQCWPGLDNVMQVGGTELDAVHKRERIWAGSTYGAHIDIATGAKDTPTARGRSSGTSYTAPQVAGVAALMLMVSPDLTPSELKAKLRDSADILEAFDGLDAAGNVSATEKNLAGGRRLNAYRAVKLALGETTVQLDPLPEIVANTDAFTSSAPLVLRERGLNEAGGWEIAQTAPVAVASLGGTRNDAVSSLRIEDGYTVQVFRYDDFRAARQTYVGPQDVDLTGQVLDNRINSYKLYVTPAVPVTEALVLRESRVGEPSAWEIGHTDPVEVRWIGWADNDQVSSLSVADGYTVEVFRRDAFRGARERYVGPQEVDLADLNNDVSSYRLSLTSVGTAPEVVVLRDKGVGEPGGVEIAHSAPAEVNRLVPGDNNVISSLVITAGYTVRVFSHWNFTGPRQTYIGPQEVDLAGQGVDNQISSYKLYATPP